jgi:hypothetical protein
MFDLWKLALLNLTPLHKPWWRSGTPLWPPVRRGLPAPMTVAAATAGTDAVWARG